MRGRWPRRSTAALNIRRRCRPATSFVGGRLSDQSRCWLRRIRRTGVGDRRQRRRGGVADGRRCAHGLYAHIEWFCDEYVMTMDRRGGCRLHTLADVRAPGQSAALAVMGAYADVGALRPTADRRTGKKFGGALSTPPSQLAEVYIAPRAPLTW